jgi:arsenate reductase-like glutaredoxin family protein
MDAHPVDGAGALALARGARRLLIKVGQETLRFDAARTPLTEGQALAYLVHDDGLMRVPVLVRDDLLVRGYTEELYREALDAPQGEGP